MPAHGSFSGGSPDDQRNKGPEGSHASGGLLVVQAPGFDHVMRTR
jgi:hypothetical protein